ncbi:Amino acid transporter ANTL2 [Galdieria sulphuraria]|nr:Amino acid transporter ANTL2 [Galdieria sulphuraria]
MLRSLRSLAPFSLAANFSLLIGFIAVISYIGSHFRWQPSSPSITQFPIFFGQITSALEGIGLVVPVEQSMKSRKHFKMVIEVAIGILSGVLLVVGALGFVTFGENTRSIIVLNMGNSPVVGLVKIVLCIGILFTYPLQLVPIVQAAEDWLAGRTITSSHGEPLEEYHEEEEEGEFSMDEVSSESEDLDSATEEAVPKELDIGDGENYYQRDNLGDGSDLSDETSEPEWANDEDLQHVKRRSLFERNPKNVMARLTIVFGTAATAALAGSSFGLFQALVGSLGAASLAYIFPSLFHLKLFRTQLTLSEKTKNMIILIFGLVGMVIGTYVSIMEMQKNPEY